MNMRESLQKLLRLHFEESNSINTFEVAEKHIIALAEIILYTSDPIQHRGIRDQTYKDAVQILPFARLRNMLPACLLEIVIHRFNKNIRSEKTIKTAQDIVLAAANNRVFWKLKKTAKINYSIEYRTDRCYNRFNSDISPSGVKGWMPVYIINQHIWVREGSFEFYNRYRRPEDDSLQILYDSRYLKRDALVDQPTAEELINNPFSWTRVNLCEQMTYIFNDPSALELLPPSTNSSEYLQISFCAFFENTRATTYFVKNSNWGKIFQRWPMCKCPFLDDEDDMPINTISEETSVSPMNQIVKEKSEDLILVYHWDFGDFATQLFILGEPPRMETISNYIVWSKNSGDMRAVSVNLLLSLLSEACDQGLVSFSTSLKEVSSNAPSPSSPGNVWVQYTWRDTYTSSPFYPTMYMNIARLLDIYQYFGTSTPNYNNFFHKLIQKSNYLIMHTERSIQINELKHIKLPKRIRDLCVSEWIEKKEVCPISMEPLNADTIAITGCFHAFQKDVLEKWFKLHDSSCPQCREKTFVFET